jgi:hypothetical protein
LRVPVQVYEDCVETLSKQARGVVQVRRIFREFAGLDVAALRHGGCGRYAVLPVGTDDGDRQGAVVR